MTMTPEITCSIVFGIIASVLASVTIFQAHRRRLVSGMVDTGLILVYQKSEK